MDAWPAVQAQVCAANMRSATDQEDRPIPVKAAFWAFVALTALNFFLIFSGVALLQMAAALYATALAIAAVLTLIGVAGARVVGLIALVLAATMEIVVVQQLAETL